MFDYVSTDLAQVLYVDLDNLDYPMFDVDLTVDLGFEIDYRVVIDYSIKAWHFVRDIDWYAVWLRILDYERWDLFYYPKIAMRWLGDRILEYYLIIQRWVQYYVKVILTYLYTQVITFLGYIFDKLQLTFRFVS